MLSSTRAATGMSRIGRPPSSTSTRTAPPGPTPRISPSIFDSTSPSGGSDTHAAVAVDDAVERRLGDQSGHRQRAVPVSDAQPRRHHAHRLHRHHARQPLHGMKGVGRARLDEGQRHVLPHRAHELLVDQHRHHVDEREPDQQHRDRERDAEHRHRRPQRLALEVAEDHARGVRQAPEHAPPFADAPAVPSPATPAASLRPAAPPPRAAPPTAPRARPPPGCRRWNRSPRPPTGDSPASGNGSTCCRARPSARRATRPPPRRRPRRARRSPAPTSRSARPARRSCSRAP